LLVSSSHPFAQYLVLSRNSCGLLAHLSRSVPHLTRQTPVLTDVKAVLLVGGFAANNWLYSNLEAHLERRNITFCRPDDQMYVYSISHSLTFDVLTHPVDQKQSSCSRGSLVLPGPSGSRPYRSIHLWHQLRCHVRQY
jgi:hypothetical protein